LKQGERNVAAESKKHGLTSWLKLKFLDADKQVGSVDEKFLSDLSEIKRIGRYEILRRLGQGSMGVVYLARDPFLLREVSVKVSRPAANVLGENADKFRRSFFVEAQSAGRLMHPNIVVIYDCGMHHDFCFLTMEYIDGPTLATFSHKDRLLPLEKVVRITISVCNALDYAHKKGVIHRDIKPSNIMVSKSGYVKVADFGIATIRTDQTFSSGIFGSPSYMSPEQVKEKPVQNTSDIFSLGCVLYELLTGEKAFHGENNFSIMYKIVRQEPVPVRQLRPEIPELIEKITRKALSTDPDRRYQSCADFAYDLKIALRKLENTNRRPVLEDILDYVHNVAFFENFTRNQVKMILNASKVIKVPKCRVIVAEGQVDDAFFVILSGTAAVSKKGKILALVSRGECFGEMAYLSGRARAATVLAKTDCILLRISATLLKRAPGSLQIRFLKKFDMTLVKRLSESSMKDV